MDDFPMRTISDQCNTKKFAVIAMNKPRVTGMKEHQVIVQLENKGGIIQKFLVPVAANCGRVTQHLLQLYRLSMDVLTKRGFTQPSTLPTSNGSSAAMRRNGAAMAGRFEDCCHPRWFRDGTELLSSTVEEMFCKQGGLYTLRVAFPGDKNFC